MSKNKKSSLEAQLLQVFKLVFRYKDRKKIINLNSKNTSKWDSLNHIKLIIYIENTFQIKFGAKQFEKSNSFKKILNYIIKIK